MPDADDDLVSLSLNGKEIQARKGELLIDAAERHGVYIPRFCYHHRMTPVGMCRMCIVEIDTGRGPAIQPACMQPVAPDMKVDTDSPTAKKAQDGILEFLLINHPLDCPVCDKGGECPLQDHTMAFGPGESRFVEEKRHYEKPIPISETVYLDRERCILCDRCTRFADEVAGDPLIHFQDRGNNTQVNTFPGHPFASYFSGNTVQICPVGALTAKPYRFKARPWDLDTVESTCTGCSVGCRITIDGSRDRVLRYQGVDSDPVNWGWLCDKGRFSFESVQHPDRLARPLVRATSGGALVEARWSDALAAAAKAIRAGLDRSGPGGVAVLGGARLTNEDAYAWAKLAKGVIGTDHVDAQLDDGLPAAALLGLPKATIDETFAKGGTVLWLGPDPKEELGVLFLRLRHAVTKDAVQLIELSERHTGITDLATASLRYSPGAAAALVTALLAGGAAPEGVDQAAFDTAAALLAKGDVRVVLGRPSLATAGAATVDAALVLADKVAGVTFLSAVRRANVHGALDLGLAPGLLPGRVGLHEGRDWYGAAWPTVPTEAGLDATGILTAAADGRIDTLVLLGVDPLTDFPDRDLASRAIAGARTVIATDLFLTASSAQADIVLPAAGFAEVDGTTTNLEGRVTTLRQKVTPPGSARSDWTIAAELARRLGTPLGFESLDDIWEEIERLAPAFAGVTRSWLESPSASDGIVVPLPESPIAIGAPASDADGPAGDPDEVTEPQADPPVDPDPITSDAGDDPEAHADAAAADSAAKAADDDEQAQAHHADAAEAAGAATTGAAPDTTAAGRPAVLAAPLAGAPVEVPAVDAYSLRLITVRRLYDQGTILQHSPASAGLAEGSPMRANPYDLERLGVHDGGRVKVTSSRGSLTAAVVPDASIPRGSIALWWNQGDPSPAALIEAGQAVTDVRLESVS
ncbi:MAG TPA: NADH-quinone oxidoreductase subunit NuoG [Acidimicrobiales bacterium]